MRTKMDDKLPLSNNEILPSSESVVASTDHPFQYEELMGGSVPCPSCNGTGRIPKEQEKQLVALIPLTDKRLKPRRTTLWVFVAVLVSLAIWALCMFFLVPRSIVLVSDEQPIVPYYTYINESVPVKFLNITNYNYLTISVVNASMVSILVLDSRRVVGQVTNLTEVAVPLRSSRTIAFNTTITFDTALLVVTVTSHYLGHSEQTSISTNQRLYCSSDPSLEDIT
ncbi:transmembrane protein 106B [Trichuris trichiura]|uniref:Transmembrane protein 106B n=1 Tax=Trichuris trichiura TaxID=36087 RepID=A0A077Z9X5_TRITR|nr:transmembrane protein 106B [Trichuris trichiura]